MSRLLKKSKKGGLPPGTLVHVGEKKTEKVRISIIDYDEAHLQEKEAETIEECFPFKEKPTVTWINIDGLHEVKIIENLGKCYGLHPLVLEDIVHTGQRPKMDDYETYIFVVLRMPNYNKENGEIEDEQISLVLGENFIVSFQEKQGDVFDPVRERIRKGKGRIRRTGADYLAYVLADAVVDSYFALLEKIGDEVEKLGEELVSNPTPGTLAGIHRLKSEMILLRKSTWPLREVVGGLERTESRLIQEGTVTYLRDVYDHAVQVIDTVETLREMVSGMLDTYLSSMSNRMNEVMKVLTMIATIFIPITFIAGIYGMNFEYMPELKSHWGYFIALSVMAVIGVWMVIHFKRRKWL